MPRNGTNGTYSLPAGNPVVTGTVISSSTQNTTMSDVATALTNSIAKDGQTTPTANLPMGGFKHTGVADGSAATEYASYGQLTTGTVTMSNKTLTAPVVNGTVTGTYTLGGTPSIPAAGLTGTVALATGGTGANTAADARTNLGLAIGTDVQAYSANLTSFAAKTAPTGAVVGDTDTQTLTNKTLTNPSLNNYTEGVVAIGNTGTAQTLSLTNGTVQTATLTGNCTFTMPTATAGKSFLLFLSTGAGGFTGTFTGVKWTGGTAPTITTTASKVDILTFTSDGTSWYGTAVQNF